MERSTFLAILVIALCIVTGLLISCESKSGQLSKVQPEKVVVIVKYSVDGIYSEGLQQRAYQYKVKRFQKGVVDDIWSTKRLEIGDTIFHKFPN